ncbi:MAG: hypothetical protein HC780_26855 [Leptolyngbyaceae cyanobacterium CSU_1_3]|nr:hypothetical protein [Leptolyngbyaceae cyanobacterium CSU_1_3]
MAITVLKIDQRINDQIRQDLQKSLTKGTSFRQLAGVFPFADPKVLSTQSQRYLRKAPESDWQRISQALKEKPSVSVPRSKKPPSSGIWLSDPLQRQAVDELQVYFRNLAPKATPGLIDQINEARRQYSGAVATLQDPANTQPDSFYDAALLDMSEADWQGLQTQIFWTTDRILAQGVAIGLPQSLLDKAVSLHLPPEWPPAARAIAAKLLMTHLQPNLIRDEEQSKLKAEQAAREVEPEMVTVRQGEVIVPGGQVISHREFVLLDHFNLSRRQTDWVGFVGFGLLIGGAVGLFWWVDHKFHPKGLRNRDYVLVWLLALSSPVLVMLGVPATNLPAIGLLVGSFYGPLLAVTSVGVT